MYSSEAEGRIAISQDDRHVKDGSSAAYSPLNAEDKGRLQKDVSSEWVLGFVFNVLSTVFVMAMGICAKLAGVSQHTERCTATLHRSSQEADVVQPA